MTKGDWLRIVGRICRIWPRHPIPEETAVEWYLLVEDLQAEHVNAAVTLIAREGAEFPPHAGTLRQRVAALSAPTPTFEAAWSAIHAAVRRHGWPQPGAAEQALKEIPLAWELVLAMGGWSQICQGGPSEHEATNPGVWRSQAEHAFRALTEERRIDQATAGLDPSLERVRQAEQRLAGESPSTLKPMGEIAALPEPKAGQSMKPAIVPKASELKPEYRAEIERMLAAGEESKIPKRWRPYVNEIKSTMAPEGIA